LKASDAPADRGVPSLKNCLGQFESLGVGFDARPLFERGDILGSRVVVTELQVLLNYARDDVEPNNFGVL
jgi:hypothetical protein